MYFSQAQMPTATSLFSAYASLSALAMLLRSILHDFIPNPIRNYIFSLLQRLFNHRSNTLTLVIEEVNSTGIGRNQVYDSAEVYLSTKVITPSTERLKISKSPKDKSLTIRLEKGEEIDDSFDNIPLRWRFLCMEPEKQRNSSSGNDDDLLSSPAPVTRYFELTFEKKFKDKVINSYIPYMLAKSKSVIDKERPLKLCTLGSRFSCGNVYWDTINLEHPSTFETLAMDTEAKTAIMEDLDRFVKRREFYRRVGRAWKRGYLLHGPPGTGKSSLIAAMANYLMFDIYDLQLGNLIKDSDLRRLLLATANRSVLVIEDIDCTIDIQNRRKNLNENGQFPNKPPEVQLTLSGLLNFIDGLWSSCGDERIIVFTTNHMEKLDPALLRPGRMDMQIHMSYLTFQSFKILVSNYLEFEGEHPLFDEIKGMFEIVEVTPAQVAEELMRSEDVDEALEGVLKFLKTKKEMIDNKDEVVVQDEGLGDGVIDEICPSQNFEISN
ncbi:AAA-ATPase At3g50940-like isoform X2 [Chenopodium quinoa]|uniref:AAA-ATPase At3g50940-like isoform X2 n=1 Tax=Chenopodium quinoa TaxID=63459 RepID=UPI000B773BAA|nr:AAA-ATPase At3g50940-like isoform X2 [Chenopodium quinoa]